MSLESATYINELISTNPAGGDQKSQGDDHIKMIKATLKNSFPNITGPMTATQVELNYAVGVTSAIQTQIDSKQDAATAATQAELDAEVSAINTDLTTNYAKKTSASIQTFSAEVRAPSFQISSGRHLKKNIRPLEVNRKDVYALRLYLYEMKYSGKTDSGVIADEVAKVFPTCVGYDNTGRAISVDYGKLGAHLAIFMLHDTWWSRLKRFVGGLI